MSLTKQLQNLTDTDPNSDKINDYIPLAQDKKQIPSKHLQKISEKSKVLKIPICKSITKLF